MGTQKLDFSLPVVASGPLAVVTKLALLDSADTVVATAEDSRTLKLGANVIAASLSFESKTHGKDLPWYRVRYTLAAKDTDKPLAQGIVSVGTIVPDLFDLRIVHGKVLAEGAIYSVRVQALNPVTSAPKAGVSIKGTLSFAKEEDQKLKPLTATTNASGVAVLRFRVPDKVAGDEASVEIEARNATQVKTRSFDVELNKLGNIIINTDKMLYQPGQSFHARALVFNAERRAIPDAEIGFTLEAPDSDTVYRATGKTNKFGIASIDWDLPESLRLGDYSLKAEISESDRYSEIRGFSTVRVSRYDLPDFTVAAKLDKTYYLAGQNAQVDVSGMYLFGKPVTRGAVRLVQEEERHWNYDKQKWDVEERAEQKGVLDGTGHAKFTVDLKEAHTDLEENNYRRFRDLSYAAYITDQSTGKTEQRRFKVRISRDLIHVYMSGASLIGNKADFFVTSAYPDGTPASCTVSVSEVVEKTRPEGTSTTYIYLRSVKTNRYGVAKVTDLRLLEPEGRGTRHTLALQATDSRGATARYQDSLWTNSDYKAIRVTTDKPLYRKGDPIEVSLASEPMPGAVLVNVVVKGATLWTSTVSLRQGRAMVVVPYQPSFDSDVSIVAFAVDDSAKSRWDIPTGVRKVLYPHDNELRVSVKTEHNSYRPGEPVSANLRVTSANGTADATALGIVVVDKAVEERVRTDEEFGSRYFGFWDWRWWYGDESVAGITRKDLDKVDLSEPLPDGYDLVAELLLQDSGWYEYELGPEIESPDNYNSTSRSFYSNRILGELSPVRKALLNTSISDWKFPTNEAELDKLLHKVKLDRAVLRDPWDNPYKFEFDVVYQNRVVRMISAGPDKRFGTADDMTDTVSWNYFSPIAPLIEPEMRKTYQESGVIVRDYATLRTALLRSGTDLNDVRDPWGQSYVYKFDLFGSFIRIEVLSHGPTAPKSKWSSDTTVWTGYVDYFRAVRDRLDDTMRIYRKQTGSLPHDDAGFDNALAMAEFSQFRNLRDVWGNPYRVAFSETYQYGDSVQIQGAAQATTEKRAPVTQKLEWVLVNSSGPDGKPDTRDDVTLARFSQIISEQNANDAQPKAIASPALSGSVGAIEGVVVDMTGAVIPGARVTAEEENSDLKFTATTDDKGGYVLRVMPGLYRVRITSPGFREFRYEHVTVHALSVTTVKATLNVGAAMETVEVQASAADNVVMTSSAMVSTTVKRGAAGTAQVKEEIFTPRLRDYFPETLYWEPSLITTKAGTAKLNFKLADNITTWKMSVLASTAEGRVGTADLEIQASQPFFVALDPPKVLTVGDQIELPVTVRNYLPAAQNVQIEMKPADWFRLLQPGKQNITVPTGDSTNALFPFVALMPVKVGKQQVVAANRTTGDAIEKPVKVHPDGQEDSRTASVLLNGSETITLDLPSEIMPNSMRAELKVYPNLLAHLAESIEASLERPYGCGEQTISSTYPSVLLLKYYKDADVPESDQSRRAKKYLRLGYQRLLNYRAESGGFTYWGHGEADVALTAYAIRFLNDASTLIDVDKEVIQDAQEWLVSVQKPDGSWQPHYGFYQGTTAYVARLLAMSLKDTSDEKLKTKIKDAVNRALKLLDDPHQPMLEPYAMSVYALTASDLGDYERAKAMLVRLNTLAHKEGNTTYWSLETNTPFYGWGRAGRIESTAIALQALSAIDGRSPASRDQIASGMLFLLKQKDRYGIWYSGHTTVNVLQTMLAILAKSPSLAATSNAAAVTINGKPAGQMQLSNSGAAGPVYLDITPYLTAGTNQIVLDRQGSGPYASAQAVANYYVPWKQGSEVREVTRLGESRALRLTVTYEKPEAKPGDTIRCSVKAERIGHQGYGMLLAEIGLPPGADVDRSSLDRAITESGWDISHYDILPDRLVLYLWPHAGGTKVDFTFRPRFGMKARSASSLMYDYYNPDEQVTLAPVDFNVSTVNPFSENSKLSAK